MHHRRSIRLKGYDYSQEGMYFVTVRTKKGECVLGEITGNEMTLSAFGEIVRSSWLEIADHFTRVSLDLFQVMPNHLHGILLFTPSVRAIHESPIREIPSGESPRQNSHLDARPGRWSTVERRKMLLPKVIGWFKMNSAKGINDLRGTSGTSFWHRNYFEHVIRDGKDLDRIRKYILDNPANWANDENFPGNVRMDQLHEGEEGWWALD